MSSAIITVDNLGKKYQILHQGEGRGGTTLREAITLKAKSLFRGAPRGNNGHLAAESAASSTREEFWALRDVSFEVKQGEVLGIIGRNGAGKSTLLKVLSRITEPSEGRVCIRGRVASLLEVGTGFHPELTGRENIFLNGAILGMGRVEIKSKFDEIVDFAGTEKFLDTPVKRYSSGMYVRLAFAIAAHLEPEILVVDEVLSVGDAAFQKQCLGKMQDVNRQGRTVLFVSHNMAAVKALCTRAALLKDGRMIRTGEVNDTIADYLSGGLDEASEREWRSISEAPGNEHIRLRVVKVRPPDGESLITIDSGAVIEIGFYNFDQGINLDCTVFVLNSDGSVLFESGRLISTNNDSLFGSYYVTGRLPGHLLNAGRYYLSVLFGKDQYYGLFRLDEVVSFDIANTATGREHNLSIAPGVIRPLIDWQLNYTQDVTGVKAD
jgi:lipopolysaccharide transport system ATP-binding protein